MAVHQRGLKALHQLAADATHVGQGGKPREFVAARAQGDDFIGPRHLARVTGDHHGPRTTLHRSGHPAAGVHAGGIGKVQHAKLFAAHAHAPS